MHRICVDVGGTFTDLFGLNPDNGQVFSEKVSTTSDAITGVIRALHECDAPADKVGTFIFGSTRATNALVEGKVEPVAFLATEGFSDTLEIRRLWREHMFGWQWDRPRALVQRDLRFGIPGRIDWQGREFEHVDLSAVDAAIGQIRKRGIRSVAVSLLFSFRNPAHEHAVRDRISELAPEISVYLSSDMNPEVRDYERGSTTVVGASLSSLVQGLFDDLEARLSGAGVPAVVEVIKSNGGIMSAKSARAKPLEIVRSGPAGGVASVHRLSRELGLPNLIGVDIGGTTADVSVITGSAITYTNETWLNWDIPIRVGMADVRSVGAGGGSIGWIDAAGRLQVGPHSAGSDPGPVCYGNGGTEPTVTDAALVAGMIDPSQFVGGRMKIDIDAARRAIEEKIARPLGLSLAQAASGILRLTAARMAQLISEMTVRVGLDPRDYTLVGFGGAGPLFIAALADEIEAAGSIVPRYASVWSAFGGLFADVVHDYVRSDFDLLATVPLDRLNATAGELKEMALTDIERDGYARDAAEIQWAFDIRYQGQSHEITVRSDTGAPFEREALGAVDRRFEAMHEKTYAHRRPDDARELTAIRLQVRVPRGLDMPKFAPPRPQGGPSVTTRPVHFSGQDAPVETNIYNREELAPGFTVDGPAIIGEAQSNTVVPPGFRLDVTDIGNLQIRRVRP